MSAAAIAVLAQGVTWRHDLVDVVVVVVVVVVVIALCNLPK